MKHAVMFFDATVPASDAAARQALDDANACRYSSDTQALYRLVQQLRTLVKHERAEVIDLRDRVQQHRITFVTPQAAESRWACIEDMLAAAADAEHEATCALAAVRGAAEPDAERAYRDGRVELERAFFEFRQAHRELSVLVAIYLRAATRGPR